MIAVLSPAKSLNLDKSPDANYTEPRFYEEPIQLANKLKRQSTKKLMELMSISKDLATVNKARYEQITWPIEPGIAKQAVFTFRGDVYLGVKANEFSEDDLNFAQKHVRILSGMYGLLRPLDLIQPYRLEMGTRISIGRKKNLYEFWRDKITKSLNRELESNGHPSLINLASKEYYQVLDVDKIKAPVYHMSFKEWRNGELRSIQFNLKRARGTMARYIVEERIDEPEGLKDFNLDGYSFDPERSESDIFMFTRRA